MAIYKNKVNKFTKNRFSYEDVKLIRNEINDS